MPQPDSTGSCQIADLFLIIIFKDLVLSIMSRQELTDLKRKNIHVACAVIERNSLVLVAQRSAAMSLPLSGNFPEGKSDPEKAWKNACAEKLSKN